MTAPDWHLTALEAQPEVAQNVHYLRPGVPLAGDDESSPDSAPDEQTERADELVTVELVADLAAVTRALLGVGAALPLAADVVAFSEAIDPDLRSLPSDETHQVVGPSRPEPTPRLATALLGELAFLDPV